MRGDGMTAATLFYFLEVNMELVEILEELRRYYERHTADGCTGCFYVDVEPYEHPCRNCQRSKRDLWTSEPRITGRPSLKR